MKKIARVLVSITCLVLLTVFTIGCADKIDKKTLRHEQERMVEYTLQNFEDVKKIEFKSVEQNLSSRGWAIHAVINDDINIEYMLSKLGENADISMIYDMNEIKRKEQKNIDESLKKVEVIYVEM
jgi:lipoprotein